MKTGDLLCSSYYREGLDLGPGIGNGDKEDLKLKKKKKTNVKLMVLLSDITESKQFFSKRYDDGLSLFTVLFRKYTIFFHL